MVHNGVRLRCYVQNIITIYMYISIGKTIEYIGQKLKIICKLCKKSLKKKNLYFITEIKIAYNKV